MVTMICNASSKLSDWVQAKHRFLAPSHLARLICYALVFAVLFGCDQGQTQLHRKELKNLWEDYSGENALAHVQALVDFGPRPPATEAIEKTRVYLTSQLELSGWKVTPQRFPDNTPRGKVDFVNLIANFGSDSQPPVFLLCSHYDTKTFDAVTFVGANDGGSSTGLLLELARVLSSRPELARKITIVFFDGEEAYENFTEKDGLYGSRYFAKKLVETGAAKQYRGGMLFDMVGDQSLTITLPPDSPPEIARDVFAAADALKVRQHFTYFQSGITDDHTPLNAIGIPTIDLIDFDYPPWHTPQDTMDKLSAESLRIVGAVACYYLSKSALVQ
jgi:glutaminyl-peptide cyclotransferase